MEQAFWAGVTAAETASQLVLGGMYCSLHTLVKKHVEWVGFGIGCWSFGIATWSISELAVGDKSMARLASMTFTAGLTIAVALVVFGLAWMTRSARLRQLGWVAAGSGAAWQPLLGYFGPFPGALGPIVPGTIELAFTPGPGTAVALGRLFFWYLAALVGLAAVLFARSGDVEPTERRIVLAGLGVLVLSLLFDAMGGEGRTLTTSAMPHGAVAFTFLLAAVLLQRYQRTSAGNSSTEEELHRCLDELATTQTTLDRVQRELGAKKQLAVVGELAAAIAHEVRNPLAIIMNAAAGLRRPTLGSEDRTTLLSILDEETARLNRLVTDLLRFARPVIIKRSSVSIVELARRAEGRLEDKHRLSISVPENPRLKFVQADANLLRLVFDNLVSNAFQAMPEGGVVRIAVSEESAADASYVRVDIVDAGHGMDEQVLARATDPFYTTRPSGTGLGLPIVQRIVEAHGGRLEIESCIGQGTKVSLFLPSLVPTQDSEGRADGVTERARV